MENDFYTMLNRNTVEALKGDMAFFMNPNPTHMPILNNSFEGIPITGANYFNLMLSNSLNGTNYTEYVRMNEVLASKTDWLSALPPENRPRGIVYQEESQSSYPRYSFMMPTARLNQDMYRDNQENVMQRANYVPFQTNNTHMGNFGAFIQEQCANAVNASLTHCTFKSNIPEQNMNQFKSLLVNEIVKNPEYMAGVANKAYQEVMNQHYLPFDRKNFIERARDTHSNEFKQLNDAITDHINDMHTNKKVSFNHEFNELSRPLIIKIENFHHGKPSQGQKDAIGGMVTDFIREKIKQDKPAEVLTDTFIGSFIEKTQKLAQVGKKVFAGVALACSILSPVLTQSFQPEDFMNITSSLAMLRSMKGSPDLKTHLDNKDTRSFHICLDKTLRTNPKLLEQAICQYNNTNRHENKHSTSMSRR
jgi:hypothetical protein